MYQCESIHLTFQAFSIICHMVERVGSKIKVGGGSFFVFVVFGVSLCFWCFLAVSFCWIFSLSSPSPLTPLDLDPSDASAVNAWPKEPSTQFWALCHHWFIMGCVRSRWRVLLHSSMKMIDKLSKYLGLSRKCTHFPARSENLVDSQQF